MKIEDSGMTNTFIRNFYYIINISFHEQKKVIIYLSSISISCIDYSSIHSSYIGNARFCLPDFLSISRDIIDFLHSIDTTECSLDCVGCAYWHEIIDVFSALCDSIKPCTLFSHTFFIFKRLLTSQKFRQCRIEETHLFYRIQPIHDTITKRTTIQEVQEEKWRLRHMVG